MLSCRSTATMRIHPRISVPPILSGEDSARLIVSDCTHTPHDERRIRDGSATVKEKRTATTVRDGCCGVNRGLPESLVLNIQSGAAECADRAYHIEERGQVAAVQRAGAERATSAGPWVLRRNVGNCGSYGRPHAHTQSTLEWVRFSCQNRLWESSVTQARCIDDGLGIADGRLG